MELTFIVEDLTLLYFYEPQSSKSVGKEAYLVENSTRVVEVSIDGPCQIFVVSL